MSKILNFIFKEVLGQSVGYFVGLSASFLVSQFFVKRGISNLWGIASKREAVDKDTYDWISFIASYLIGLLAMATVNTIIKRFNSKAEA